jgi:hypothetical protein
MSQRPNIVLLATDSEDSQSKARHYRTAAFALGLTVAHRPNDATKAISPCSDYLALEAAWMCQTYGVPGPSPLAVTVATNKSLAYSYLKHCGLPTLFWIVPIRESDLRASFAGPVIVKPEISSGSFSWHSWGYRIYRNIAEFRLELREKRLTRRFFDYQMHPDSRVGRYLVMEYVGGGVVYSVEAIAKARAFNVYGYFEQHLIPDSRKATRSRSAFFERPPARLGTIGKAFEAFVGLGLRHSVIYFQYVRKGGRPYILDVNVRPGSLLERVAIALGLPFFERLLRYRFGLDRRVDLALPARCLGVRRMSIPIRAGKRRAIFGGECIPVVSEINYDPKRPYDTTPARPIFALPCDSRREFEMRADEIAANTRIVQIR